MAWVWQVDLFTSLNAIFDIVCITFGIYLFTIRFKAYRASIHSQSQSQSQSNPTTPTLQIQTYSLWARKPRRILLASILVTTLWHFVRILLIVVMLIDTFRRGRRERAESEAAAASAASAATAATAASAGATDASTHGTGGKNDGIPSPEQQPVPVNPLLVFPALYCVLALPILIALSRVLLVALFAFSKKASFPASASAPANTTATSSVPSSPVSPKSPSSPKVKQRGQSPFTQVTGAINSTSIPPAVTAAPSPAWTFIESLPSRVHGPNQNLYLLAFYICTLYAVTFMPFSYNLVWYLDTPRVEFVSTLYLAGILQDAKNVPGLSTRERVGGSLE